VALIAAAAVALAIGLATWAVTSLFVDWQILYSNLSQETPAP